MTGIVINGNEYQVNTGSTKVEYASMGEGTIGYSMYGDNIPEVQSYVVTITAMPDTAVITTTVTDIA